MAHPNTTKIGRSPTHPRADRRIDSNLAAFITQQCLKETGDENLFVIEGDWLCRTCYEKAKKQFLSQVATEQKEENETRENDAMDVDYRRSKRQRVATNMIGLSLDDIPSDKLSSSSSSSNEEILEEDKKYHESQSKEMLNEIFKIVGLLPIIDV